MRVIVYDCRDAPRAELRAVTLRVIDESGATVLQSPIYADAPERIAKGVAAGLGCQLQWIGAEVQFPPPDTAPLGDAAAEPPPATPADDCYVSLCRKCGGVDGWIDCGSGAFDEWFQEWVDQGRQVQRTSTRVAKAMASCLCHLQAAGGQRTLF